MDRTLSGKRIELVRMEDPYTNLKQGDKGTIEYTDDIGQIHVKWDNGSKLAIIPEIDEYDIIEESLTKLKFVRLFEEFVSGSDTGYVNVKMEELSDLVDSGDEFISFKWSLDNNKLHANLNVDGEITTFDYDLSNGKLVRNIKGETQVDQCNNVDEAMHIIEECIYDCLGISERAKTKGEKYKGKHIPAKYLTRKKKAMKKEIDEFRGKKSYKAEWEADIDKRSGKRIGTKKSASTKAYQKMFGKNESLSEDNLLELFYFIDNLSDDFDSQSEEGSSSYINYTFDDKLDYILIEYGWSTYEEGGNEDIKIFWKESPIRVEFSEDVSTVYGSYDNQNVYSFNNLSEVINFLSEKYA